MLKSLAELRGWSCADADQGGFYKSKSEFPIPIHLTRPTLPLEKGVHRHFSGPLRSIIGVCIFIPHPIDEEQLNEYIQLQIP